jgi:hypothetical protein
MGDDGDISYLFQISSYNFWAIIPKKIKNEKLEHNMLQNRYKYKDIGEMMNALSLAPKAESKDIKLSDKKITDSKSDESKDFFENIISSIILDEEDSGNKSFLLSKILNLSSEFEKKEKILSNFSDGSLFTDNQIGQVSIQDLLKIATMIKKGEDPATFPTDSKTLKLSLLKSDVKEQFKSAKNIKDILDIAKKNNIEVKNFQFFNEAAALDPKDKKMVQKIKSEDIFKLIDRQVGTKTNRVASSLNSLNEVLKPTETKSSILQSVLSSKEINKPIQKKGDKIDIEIKKAKIITKDNKEPNKIETKRVIAKTQEVNITNTITSINSKELKQTNTKSISTEKIVLDENKELKKSENMETKSPKSIDIKSNENSKQKVLQSNFKTLIQDQKIDDPKDMKTVSQKTEPLTEKTESTTEVKESSDKHVLTNETKTHNIEKTKNSPDVKRTFNTFAQEFKEKVESYKPPLMKIKMELKPVGLGDVDVTLLSRGNNLQVNINSNSSTIAIFAQNQVEFKNSLVNMGFSDLQMNFGEGQKKEQDAQNQKNGKNVFEQIDDIEEQDGFEMIVPRYV